jgi:glutamate-ammonia-ligase adenylyltransferase
LNKVIGAGPAEVFRFLRGGDGVESVLASALPYTINPARALRHLTAWAESLVTYGHEQIYATGWSVSANDWTPLIKRLIVVLSSPYLSNLLVSRPLLAGALFEDQAAHTSDYMRIMREAVDQETDVTSKPDVLRRAWYRLVVGIGYQDMSVVGSDHLRTINLAQTALAEAVLRIASAIALESIGIADVQPSQLPFTVLGLGRLGHAGMDYGSDLDLLVVFDDEQAWPPAVLSGATDGLAAVLNTPHEFYARLTAQIVRVLSSITREGLLYRSDLRLRPEGKSGPVALGLSGLVAYITNRASAWEHSAYLKAREVAGDLRFGERARKTICEASFDAAARNESLRDELGAMRSKQMQAKARGSRPNIKWGPGGMTDVYFVTRYLQLRDRIYFPPENGTTALIVHLGESGALDNESVEALFHGYSFLRTLDHWMRLLLDRPSPVLPASTVPLRDISRALGLSPEDLESAFAKHTREIRKVYNRIFEDDGRLSSEPLRHRAESRNQP